MKKKYKITLLALGALVLIWVAYNAYLPIDGYVVDVETGKPIEGAIVFTSWHITYGLGLTYSKVYTLNETTTDQSGRFRINEYVLNPFVNKPKLTIYKAGYVCWNSRIVFPEGFREGFKWGGGQTYMLERFKLEYSRDVHESFFGRAVGVITSDSKIQKAFRWEEVEASKERQKRREVSK